MTAVQRAGAFRVDDASALIIAISLLLLAFLPLAMRVDEGVDRNRPMYRDLSLMLELQDESLAETGRVVPVRLSDGETATIADEEFVSSEGVSIDVRGVDDDTAYCITVRNEYGSHERCS
jgi:hypothetical protein